MPLDDKLFEYWFRTNLDKKISWDIETTSNDEFDEVRNVVYEKRQLPDGRWVMVQKGWQQAPTSIRIDHTKPTDPIDLETDDDGSEENLD